MRSPSCSSDWPGTSASLARPAAANESPIPSKFPALAVAGVLIPTLSNAACKLPAAAAAAGVPPPSGTSMLNASALLTAAASRAAGKWMPMGTSAAHVPAAPPR